MKKMFGKALAMAVMMSVLAGGSAYAQTIDETLFIDGSKPITLNPNAGISDPSITIGKTDSGNDNVRINNLGLECYHGDLLWATVNINGLTTISSTNISEVYDTGIRIYKNGDTKPVMKFDVAGVDVGNKVVENVKAGTNDTDAVNFSQIKAVDGNYVKEANTVAQNFTALDAQVKTNADDISTLKSDMTTAKSDISALQADVATNKTDISGLKSDVAKNKTDISDLKSDVANKANQADLTAEETARINADKDLQSQIDAIGSGSSAGMAELNNKISATNDRVDRVGATAAALAGINYQPMAKGQSQVAVGMGGYKGKKATALGLAYQFNDRVSGSVAGAANGSEHMFNVGFNYLFGQHSDKDVAQMAAGSLSLAEAELKAENSALKNKVADQEARISRLEKIIASLGK